MKESFSSLLLHDAAKTRLMWITNVRTQHLAGGGGARAQRVLDPPPPGSFCEFSALDCRRQRLRLVTKLRLET